MPFVTINGHRIHYLEATDLGYDVDAGKLPIVLVHGLGSSENYYVPILEQLGGHRVVVPTTYGAGQSNSKGEQLTLEQLADDVIGLMDHLEIEKAILGGHSMGGPMVLTTAAKNPGRVAGVVCIGPVNPASVKPEIFTSRIETVMKDGMEPLANTIPKAATNARSTTLQRAMIRELILGQDPNAYASHCNVIVNMKDPGFAKIQTPVLLLAGDEDKSAPVEGVQYIHDHLGSKQKELTVLNGVGHWHCIEASEEVGKEIAAFATQMGSRA
ncbi:related to alpha/beta hydrolase [Ramularia collo-cygni]|uniref:Related to alpha/beta hydrolase n=1 Tax=Ramularia collo-cygni TaxID=112498 RepID=A0A2D3UTR4_9PEZI|nr:related to alpha/beta hydrolase [Ramularia collo-cygni]CZT15257.1 related to alpha/beta hydrolase [Ramularia collo-cygni]